MRNSRPTERIDYLGLGITPLDLLFEVEAYPKSGSKIDGLNLTIQGGGPVPNVAVGLVRMGHSAALISAFADDFAGRLGIEEFRKEGVDTRFLVSKKGTSDTAVGLIAKGTGQRTMVLNRGIHVKPRDIILTRYPIPRVVHLDGRDLQACMKLARWGRRVDAIISFDIGSIRNDVSPIFPLVDHLVVADSYALPFTKSKTATQALNRLNEHCSGTIVITTGTKGSVGYEAGHIIRQPAYKVRSVDTTGAGDAFHAGYIYGLLHDYDLAARLRFGAATAALKCTRMGARTGIPNARQIQRFLKNRPRVYA